MMGAMAEVKDNPDQSRYELYLDGERVGLMTYTVVGDVVVTPHTEIDPGHGGQGLGTLLVSSALDEIRASGRFVEPSCPFVRHFIDANPAYRDLVKAG